MDITGQNLFDAVRPEDRAAAVRLLTRLREDPERRGARGDWTLTDPSGRQLQVEVRCRDLRDEPTVGGLVLALRDVSEQCRLERQLTHRAYHDALTGLPNRALFQQRLEAALSEGGRDGVVGVLMLDLDDFKVVNDTLGHAAGDELLVQVADRLTGLLRPVDTAARLGGDEFGALVTDAGSPEDIEQIAERVVRQFAHPFELGGVAVSSSVTVGLATSRDAATARDLLRHADLALYVAKQSGKGQWRRYRPADHAGVLRRMELRSALSHAVATGAFELEYQPIVALESGRAVGMEALVRWRHPVRGPVPPAEFIDVAEETGLIVPIGGWVLTRALAHAATWAAAGDDGPYLSVNVSARQFRQPGFVATVRRTLETTGLSPSRLVIEITESALMREPVWSGTGRVAGPWGAGRDRRLRHRLLVAQLPAPAAGGPGQAGEVLPDHHHLVGLAARRGGGHPGPGRPAGPGGGGRGGRPPSRTRPTAAQWLPVRPGFPLRPAAAAGEALGVVPGSTRPSQNVRRSHQVPNPSLDSVGMSVAEEASGLCHRSTARRMCGR